MQNKLVTAKTIIYGEGSVSPAFIGSVWIKDDRESNEAAEYRYTVVIKKLGFDYLGEGK